MLKARLFCIILREFIFSLTPKTKRMNTKTLVGGLIGAVAFFFLGWVIFGMVLGPMTDSYANMRCMRPKAEISLPLLIVANLLWGLTFAYLFSKMPSVTGFPSAAVQGAFI